MPIDVRMPDGTLVKNVPDNITQADLAARFDAFKAQVGTPVDSVTPQAPVTGPEGAPIPPILQTQEKPKIETASPLEALVGSTKRMASDVMTGAQLPFDANKATIEGMARQEGITERPATSLDAVTQAYEKEGFLPAAKEVATQFPSLLAEQAPLIGSMYAGAKTGAMLPVPPMLKPYTAIAGSILLPLLSYSGSSAERKAAEQIAKGEKVDIDASGAFASGAFQASLDRLSLGLSGLSRLFGISYKQLGTKAANKIAQESIATSIAKGTIKTELAEIPTEIAQQAIERYYAGLSLTDADALKEYGEIAYATSLMGPVGGAARLQERSQAKKATTPTPPPVSERIEPEVTPREPSVEVGQPTIVQQPEIEAYDKEIAKAEAAKPAEPTKIDTSHDTQAMLDELSGKDVEYVPEEEDKVAEPKPRETIKEFIDRATPEELEDFRQKNAALDMSDEGRRLRAEREAKAKEEAKPEVLYSVPMGENTEYHVLKNDLGHVANLYDKDAGRYVPDSARIFPVETFGAQTEIAAKNFVDEEQNKAAAYEPSIKEEPTGVITEEEKEFTPVGGRLINKADVEKIGTESKLALEQNLKNQELQRDKQIRREIREDKFPAAETPSLASALKDLGGINVSNKLDMLKDTGKVFNYESAFSKDGEDLLTHIENGSLDEYLPHQLRLSNTPPNEAFDPRPAYDYISSVIESKQKVHDYEYELAKIDHKNKIREKYLAKQYMEPNEAAQAAAAEIQGKEYMNIKPDEIVPPLGKAPEVGTMEWLTEDNPPVHNLYEGNKSLKVEMNKLVRDIESGRASDTEVKDAVLNIYETTKKPKVDQPLVRGPEHIKRRLLEAKLNGTLSPKAVDMAEWLINKNPEIMRESAISIKEEPKGNKKAGEYVPEKRLIQLFNHIGDEKTPVHESLHSVERLLPEDIRSGIRKAWLNNLFKQYNNVSKGKDENLKQYFKGIVDYHLGENPIGDVVAKDLIQKGLVDKSNYQFFNPSEFWAIRGSDIVANRFNAEISKSTVNKLKQWIREFIQKLKSTFGLNSDAPIIRALDSLAKSDGKFKTNDMLAESAEYASISQPPKNIKGQEVIPQWESPDPESKLDLWIYRLQNKQIDTKRVQQAIGEIEDNWNVYEKEQLYHGRTASGIRNFLLKELLPIIKEIERLKINPEEVRTYLHNRHAEERNIQMNKINPDIYDPKTGRTTPNPLKDKGSGIYTADAKTYLAGVDTDKKKTLEDIAKKFDQMIKGTQQILINSGAESADTIAKWNKTYEHYVPLFRVEDEMARPSGLGGVGQGFAVSGPSSKRAMGSEKEVQDILSNIIAQRERALIRAEKIRVGRALYGLAIQNPNPDFWLPINPDAIRSKKKAIAELISMGIPDAKNVIDNLMKEPKERYLKKVQVAEGRIEPEEDFDFDSGLPVNESKEVVAAKVNVMARYKDFVFPIRINGKDRYIFFNKNDPRALRMVESLKNLDVENLGWAIGLAGKATRWFKNVNTQYNPVFGLINYLRDFGGTLLNLTNTEIKGKQAQVIAGSYKAMAGILNVHRAERKGKEPSTGPWATLYQEYRDQGTQTGYRDSLIRNQEEMQIIEHTLAQFKDGNTKKAFYAVLGGLTDYNDMMENAFRLSAYKVALDQGLSKQKAAIIAKNLTVNFDRKGAWTAQTNALYAFFNASVQGTERIYQTLKGPKGKIIIGGGILAGMVQALMLAAAGYDDDDPPEFVREKNFIIPLANGTYFTIPYPLGYNVLPSSGRIVMEFMLHGGKNPGKHIVSLTSAIVNSVNPLGSSGLATQTLMPTVIDPLIALGENRDSFGRPISREDRATSPTPGYSRSRETSTALGKGIAEFLNWASGGDKYVKGKISPTGDDVDFLAGQVGGGLYREISKAAKAVGSTITGEEIPSYRRPIVGRFIGETGSNASISQTFYENVTRLTDHENTIKGLKKDKLPTDSYKAKNPEARLWPRANAVENEVNAINKQKRLAIEKNKPKEVIQRLDEKKARIMKQFNDQVKKVNAD